MLKIQLKSQHWEELKLSKYDNWVGTDVLKKDELSLNNKG